MSATGALKRMSRALCAGVGARRSLNRFSPRGRGYCVCREEEPPIDPCFPNVEIEPEAAATLGPKWEEVRGDWSVAVMPEGNIQPPQWGATVSTPGAIAVVTETDIDEYLSIECTLASVPVDGSARLLLGYENELNHYFMEFNRATQNFLIGRVSAGVESVLATHPAVGVFLSPFVVKFCASPAGYLFTWFRGSGSNSFARLAALETDVKYGKVGIGTGTDWTGGSAQFDISMVVNIQRSASRPDCQGPCGIRCAACGLESGTFSATKIQLDISGISNYTCDCADLNQTFIVPITHWDVINSQAFGANFCFGELIWSGIDCATELPWYDKLYVRYGSFNSGINRARTAWFVKDNESPFLISEYRFEFPSDLHCNDPADSNDVIKYSRVLGIPFGPCGDSQYTADGSCTWTPLGTYESP